jgi:hypothetical protein
MAKLEIDSRVQRMIEENWDDTGGGHEEYCQSNRGYKREFIRDMDNLFNTIQEHTLHTVLFGIRVYLEDSIADNARTLESDTPLEGEDIRYLQNNIRACEMYLGPLETCQDELRAIDFRGDRKTVLVRRRCTGKEKAPQTKRSEALWG